MAYEKRVGAQHRLARAGRDHRGNVVGGGQAHQAGLRRQEGVAADGGEVAAVAHADVGDAGGLRLGDGGLHAERADNRAEGRVAIHQRPGRAFAQHMRPAARVGAAGPQPAHVGRQQFDAVGADAEFVGGGQHVGGRLRVGGGQGRQPGRRP